MLPGRRTSDDDDVLNGSIHLLSALASSLSPSIAFYRREVMVLRLNVVLVDVVVEQPLLLLMM